MPEEPIYAFDESDYLVEVNKTKEPKRYYRIFNTLTKKYVKMDDNGFLVFEYPLQRERWIEKKLNNSKLYKVVEFKKVNKNAINK